MDRRYTCGIALDPLMLAVPSGVYDAVIPRPLLFINSSGSYQTVDSIKSISRLLESSSNSDDVSSRHNMMTLMGSVHRSQMDTLFVLPHHLFDEKPSLDMYTCHHGNMSLCHAFLKRYLLCDPQYQGYLQLLDSNTEHIIQGTNK